MNKKHLIWLVGILCVAGAVAAFLLPQFTKNFTGDFVGPAKVPGTGWSVLRLHIEKHGDDFDVTARADHYRRVDNADFTGNLNQPHEYRWDDTLSASYRARMVGNDLVLDQTMGFILSAGKLTGTLVMPDGTLFKKDTPENYQALKKELTERLRQREPEAIIRE